MGNIWGAFVGLLQQILLTLFAWTGSAGLAIILFTIVARLIILPLTITSIRSTRRMQELQPLIKELQRKHGKDPQKLNEETVRLYRENKVNPAGGCLPMLLQLPIFFGVYQAVINLAQVPPSEAAAGSMITALSSAGVNVTSLAAELNTERLYGGFLWLTDLGSSDPLFILPVLSVLFQLIVQLMAMPRIQDPQQKAMSQSMLIMPIVFGYIGFTFPSGAVLYWVVGSILSMIQQYVISGWGSLANYLKFLPADSTGLFPSHTPAITAATARATAENNPSPEVADGQKIGFWDVMRPLTEQTAGGPSSVASEVTETDSTEDALNDVRRRLGQQNPRRRKPRR